MFSFSFSEFCVVILVVIVSFKPKEILEIVKSLISGFEKLREEFELKKNEIILLEEQDEINKLNFTQGEVFEEFENHNK